MLQRHKAWNSSWADKDNSNQTPKDKVVCNSRIRSMEGALRTWTLIWYKSDWLTVIKDIQCSRGYPQLHITLYIRSQFTFVTVWQQFEAYFCDTHCHSIPLGQPDLFFSSSHLFLRLFRAALCELRHAHSSGRAHQLVCADSTAQLLVQKLSSIFEGLVRIKVEMGTLRIKAK